MPEPHRVPADFVRQVLRERSNRPRPAANAIDPMTKSSRPPTTTTGGSNPNQPSPCVPTPGAAEAVLVAWGPLKIADADGLTCGDVLGAGDGDGVEVASGSPVFGSTIV